MSYQKLSKYAIVDECPACGSNELSYKDPFDVFLLEGDRCFYPAKCDKCGLEFRQYYRLEFDGITVEVDGKDIDIPPGE